MVREKLAGREYIILCLEDCSDWGHATTRKVVMQVRIVEWCQMQGTAALGVEAIHATCHKHQPRCSLSNATTMPLVYQVVVYR